MSELLYRKVGRRYLPAGNYSPWGDDDLMKPGQARLVVCSQNGERRYTYDVTPDTAGLAAAIELHGAVMEKAIRAASSPRPLPGRYDEAWTPEQQSAISEAQAMLNRAGVLTHTWIQPTIGDCIRAGVAEVRRLVEGRA